jgi:alpha-mannosidase
MTHKNKPGKRGSISRRTFINRTAAGTAIIALEPLANLVAGDAKQGTWPSDASRYRFHMIGHAHIDPVWLWPWSEGISVVHSTFRSALDRMKETPEFCFIGSSAQFYAWVSENDPEMLEEIRKRVDEGRWNIVGGWWVEPDVNIPCGESLVRQGLYGQLTLQRLLGRRAKVASNPDSFGHAATLPQILKMQGMENYIFMRPGPKEKQLPADLFWWEGLDGTRILTYRIQLSYNDEGPVRERIETILARGGDQPMKSFMAFYGVGDHGGGATKENIRSVNELKTEKGAPVIFYSTPNRYFEEIREDKSLKLPVVKDDLQHHAVGCYTAESGIKKGNRCAEAALLTAEKIAALGTRVWRAGYSRGELTSAWQRVLFLQFHDSLAGTSLYDHSQTAREGYGYALDIARQTTGKALQKLEWQVPAEDPDSQYLLVFNPHAWEVSGIVEYDLNWDTTRKTSRVEAARGISLQHQWTRGSSETGNRKKLVARVPLPPLGYCQIRLMEGIPENTSGVKAEGNTLENESIRLRISDNGSVSLFDKEQGKEIFSGGETGCRAIILDDPSDTWSHDVKAYTREIGSFGKATMRILENGPLRATIRATSHYGNSALSVDWTLYSGSRNVAVNAVLDWHEQLKMLKFSFPVDVEAPVATYETPYGHIVRAANGNEEPGQRWIDLSGMRQGIACGLAVINDAKYGYSVSGNDMRISIARAAVYAHHNPRILDPETEHQWMDQGIQNFRMLLVPHAGNWISCNVARMAEEFISPPEVIYQGIHGGSAPKSDSFLSVSSPGVIVSALKLAESGDELIVRCVETSGTQVKATLDLRFANLSWSGDFHPCEIKTLSVGRKAGEVREVTLLED